MGSHQTLSRGPGFGGALDGVALSIACQVATFFALGLIAGIFHESWIAFVWSVPQWGIVVPLFRGLKGKNNERGAAALLATSAAGVIVNAGFVWLVIKSIEHVAS